MSNIINSARRLLIRFGKTIPFVLCFIILLSYLESMVSVVSNNYVLYGNFVTPYTPLSNYVAELFEYDMLTAFAILILSIAIETCIWNKLAIIYLFIQLGEKSYFGSIELYPEYIMAVCAANILVCSFLCYKGFKIIISK